MLTLFAPSILSDGHELTQCSAQKKLYQSYSCCGGQGQATCVGKNLTSALDAVVGLRGDYAKKLGEASPAPTIKMSSLSYANSAGRVGFNYEQYYNDFNNEGHMYPVHGGGDLDKTKDLMAKFAKSASGQAFGITDLDIMIKVTDESLTNPNSFFDLYARLLLRTQQNTTARDRTRPHATARDRTRPHARLPHVVRTRRASPALPCSCAPWHALIALTALASSARAATRSPPSTSTARPSSPTARASSSTSPTSTPPPSPTGALPT